MTTTTTCSICSDTGIDPGFLDACKCQSGPVPTITAREVKPTGPTAKQLEFATKLLTELVELDGSKTDKAEALRLSLAEMSPKQASAMIDYLLGCVKSARSTARKSEAIERTSGIVPGIYRAQGRIVKVQAAKSTGNLYGSLLDESTGKYEYTVGALRYVSAADRISLEEAAEVTRRIGRCCVCCRTLSNPDSIDAGIGPVCAGKL